MSDKTNRATTSAEKTKTSQATWPDFAASLYDKLTGRGANITYEFDDFSFYVPAKLGDESDHFHWKMNGSLNIRTQDDVNSTGRDE